MAMLPIVAIVAAGAAFAYQQVFMTEGLIPPDYTMEDIPEGEILRTANPANGTNYSLYIQLPPDYHEANKRYPVFYILDGRPGIDAYEQLVLPLLEKRKIPELIFVGIDHGRPRSFAPDLIGLRDYSFVEDPEESHETGGADAFLAFIDNDVVPLINDTYRTVPEDRGLGGLGQAASAILYAALNRPAGFSRYIALNPVIAEEGLTSIEAEHERSPVAVYTAISENAYDYNRLGWETLRGTLRDRATSTFRSKAETVPELGTTPMIIQASHNGLIFVYDD